jgi:hypothetical protein
MAFFADTAEGYLYDSNYSVEVEGKMTTEKSPEKDVEKDAVKDKIFHSYHTVSFSQPSTTHIVQNVRFRYSAYLSLPELPPEMI